MRDLEELGEVPLADSGFQYFHVLRRPSQDPVNENENVHRFVNISYIQSQKQKQGSRDAITQQYFAPKLCDFEDFGN